MKKIMVVIAATGLLLGFVYTCSPYSKTQKGETLQFQYPEVNSIQDTVTLQGSVFAAELQRLYPRGSSRVLEIYVSEGQQVTAGQCLMKLEQTEPAADYCHFSKAYFLHRQFPQSTCLRQEP